MKIVTKKTDYSTVQSKCGSNDNAKHTPRGGDKKVSGKYLTEKEIT